jgi:putative ABC transport system permease protein
MIDGLLRDLRYALKGLVRTPTFTTIALLTLGIGTGANVTVFSFVSALLFRPAPGVADPRSLIAIYTSDFSSGPYGDSSYLDFLSLQRDASAFQAMAAEQDDAIGIVRTKESVERVRMSAVTGTYFDLLGVRAVAGRLLAESDAAPSAPSVAVIGEDLWARAFDRNPSTVGSVVTVAGRAYTIVGVASREFQGLDLGRAFELWSPYLAPPETPDARGNRGLTVVGRLRPDATLQQAQAQLTAIAARLAQDYPATNRGTLATPNEPRPMLALVHTRLPPGFRGEVGMIGATIMAAVGLVLVIACGNVASLLLSRGTARTREIAVRLALGAGRRRIVQQLIAESLLLGAGGGALGLLFALWTADVLPSFFPQEQAAMLQTGVDMRAFGFALGISLFSGVLFGLAPALHAVRPSAPAVLRGGSGRVTDSRAGRGLRRALVVGQVAMAVVLLVSAGLLIQSLNRMLRADFGFATRNAALASVDLPQSDFTRDQRTQYFAAVRERIAGLPGIVSVSFARALPMSGTERRGFRPEGYTPRRGEDMEFPFNIVDDRYFRTLQIPLIEGRDFDGRDRTDSTRVAIVKEELASRYFNGQAVGRRITDSGRRALEIVGVVRSSRQRAIAEAPMPAVYYPLAQEDPSRMTLIARTEGDSAASIETIRQQMAAVDRGVPVFRTRTLAAHIDEVAAGDRLTTSMVAVCGGMALLLAVIGVYGVIAYAVVRRTKEIGVRVALGAPRAHIVRLVVAEGLSVTLAGIVIGLVATFAAARGLASLLYGVSASDASTYAIAALLLAVVALLAAVGPTRRALRVEPISVLRAE